MVPYPTKMVTASIASPIIGLELNIHVIEISINVIRRDISKHFRINKIVQMKKDQESMIWLPKGTGIIPSPFFNILLLKLFIGGVSIVDLNYIIISFIY